MRHYEVKDLYWAAGFLEGEGCFSSYENRGRQRQSIIVAQTHRPPLDLLQSMFGGNINGPYTPKRGQPYYNWYLGGPRARGVMMTIYQLMSPRRREQIRTALKVSS